MNVWVGCVVGKGGIVVQECWSGYEIVDLWCGCLCVGEFIGYNGRLELIRDLNVYVVLDIYWVFYL